MTTNALLKGVLRVGIVVVGLGTAQGAAAADPQGPQPFRAVPLGVGDVLTVTAFARPDLTGTYAIGPEGVIRLPLVGRVKVVGEPIEAIEAMLRERISTLLDYQVPVTVDVDTFRPVYVIGDVTRPGEFAFTADMTVKMAFAKAGGRPSIRQMPASVGVNAALAERDLWRAQVNLRSLLIRQAAVEAMLTDAPELTLPRELEPLRRSPSVQDQVARQNSVIAEAREAMASARDMLRRQHEQLSVEIRALEAEGASLQRQADLIQSELGNAERLADRGLTTNSRMLDVRQMKETVEANRHRQAANLSRARQQQLALESRLDEVWATWRRDRMNERFTLGRDIEVARADLEGTKNHLMFLSQGNAIPAFEGGPAAVETLFVVTRSGPDGPREMTVDAHDPLLPGDILEVRAAEPGTEVGGTAAAPPTNGTVSRAYAEGEEDGTSATATAADRRQSW